MMQEEECGAFQHSWHSDIPSFQLPAPIPAHPSFQVQKIPNFPYQIYQTLQIN